MLVSGDPRQQGSCVFRHHIAAPGDMVVGPDQRQVALVEGADIGVRHIEDCERNAASRGGVRECGGLRSPRSEPKQSQAAP